MTITSNSAGRETSCIAALSTSRWSSSTSGYSPAIPLTTSRHSREVSSTLALSTEVTRGGGRCPRRAVRGLEAGTGDPLDLADRVLAGVVGRVAVAAAVAEVDAAGQLAHDQQVGAGDPLLAQRAGVDQRRAGTHRPQVGVEAHALAQAEQPLLGPRRVGSVVSHFGPPTAPSRTASEARQTSSTSSVSATPCASIEQPPIRLLVELELAQRLEQLRGPRRRSRGRSRRRAAALCAVRRSRARHSIQARASMLRRT